MSKQSRRSFGVLDGMILVAAIAPAIKLTSHSYNTPFQRGFGFFLGYFQKSTNFDVPDGFKLFIADFESLTPLLICLTPAILIIRLRKPRPRLRVLVRHPGFVASVFVVTLLSLDALRLFAAGPPNLIIFALLENKYFWSFMDELTIPSYNSLGPLLITAWLFMAIGGTFRPQTDWMDRFGCAIGFLLILAYLLDCVAWAMQYNV